MTMVVKPGFKVGNELAPCYEERTNELGTMPIPKIGHIVNDCMERHILKNSSVVIDAKNYFYNMYEDSKINYMLGSNSNEFASYLRIKLHIFRKANVKCYFVFKGGDSVIEEKIKKFDKKYSPQIYKQPVLIVDTIKQVLEELKLDYATCVFESKDECAALAERLQCPVISNDYDFCFFKNISYISYFRFTYDKRENGIACKRYCLQDFLNKYSLTEEKAAIFVLLLHSKYYPIISFETLLEKFNMNDSNCDTKIRKVIRWLAAHELTDILDEISQHLTAECRTIFLQKYETKLSNIRHPQGGLVGEYLASGALSVDRHDADWFAKGVATNVVPVPYINLYKWKVLEGANAIENKHPEDSIMLAQDIILYAYNLLTDFQEDHIKLYLGTENFVQMSTRDTRVRKPHYSCRGCVFNNGWEHVKNYKLFEHYLSENCIKIETNDSASLLIIALVYFSRKKLEKHVDVTKVAYCVIISFVMLNIVNDKEGSYRKRVNNIYEPDCNKAKEATDGYFRSDFLECRDIFDGDVATTLVQFQYCLLHLNYLNRLCGSPYQPSRYHRAYNGTFVYKLLLEMTRTPDADIFTTILFKRSPSVLRCIKKLISLYHEIM